MQSPPTIPRSTSLRRGLEILLVLGSEAPPLGGFGVTRIAALTGYEKSQVSRALSALADHGFVERVPGGRGYRLGWACFALSARAGEPRLLEEAAPVLATLVADVSETAHLSVLRGTQVLTLLSEAPPHSIAARGWVGRTVPAYCSSSGRALLIDHDRAALAALFRSEPFEPLGPNCATHLDELEHRIKRARQLGYVRAVEESEPGLVAVAAPVRDGSGRVIAAINVSAPKFRLGRRLSETGALVRAAADRVSNSFGMPALQEITELAQ